MRASFFFAEKPLERSQHTVSGGSCPRDAGHTQPKGEEPHVNSSGLCFMVETQT